MKCYSNIKQPDTPLKWLDGEWALFVNHKENPDVSDDEQGKRWEADFTVVKSLTMDEAIHAFTRMEVDPELDYKVYTSSKVDGVYALDVKKEYHIKVATTIFKPLPTSGRLKKGQIYSYSNGAVMVVQDHERTIHTPEETPALFSFYRPNPEGTEWIAGEQVALNSTRTYGGKTYKCIQAHQTQDGWKPDVTPALWQVIVTTPEISEWVQPTGAHDAYRLGAKVTYQTFTWECTSDYNVYAPGVFGWKKI